MEKEGVKLTSNEERMKGISSLIRKSKEYLVDSEGATHVGNFVKLFESQYEYLIEQYEQVPEMEKKLHDLEFDYDERLKDFDLLQSQNKRNREVIREINRIIGEAIEAIDNGEKVQGLEHAIKISWEALDDSSD